MSPRLAVKADYLLGIALALGAALLYAIAALIIKRLTGTARLMLRKIVPKKS